VRFLIDTNIFLEILLEQDKTEDAKAFLLKVDKHDFFASDFSVHSIGLILFYRKQKSVFHQFVQEMLVDCSIPILSLAIEDMQKVITTSDRFNLDFDDAYQYVAAEKYNLEIISFDTDFDRTTMGRKEPGDIK
jgi:hypothetical protein